MPLRRKKYLRYRSVAIFFRFPGSSFSQTRPVEPHLWMVAIHGNGAFAGARLKAYTRFHVVLCDSVPILECVGEASRYDGLTCRQFGSDFTARSLERADSPLPWPLRYSSAMAVCFSRRCSSCNLAISLDILRRPSLRGVAPPCLSSPVLRLFPDDYSTARAA